jgi:hypothetical protein
MPVMSRRGSILLLGAAIVVLGSCGGPSPSSSATQQATTPTSPTPVPAPAALGLSTNCLGPFHPGDDAALACFVFVQEATAPASTSIGAFADLRAFGGAAETAIARCPACGGPPWTFDLDVHVPADISTGVKTFPVWATDAEGRRTDATASIVIVPR